MLRHLGGYRETFRTPRWSMAAICAVPTQEEMAKRYEEGMKSGTAKRRYTDAMKNLKENPMLLAADEQDRMLANTTAAISSGYWAKRLRESDFEQMKQTASTVGAERLASGAIKALPKYKRRLAQVYSGYQAASDAAKQARKSGAGIGAIVEASVNELKKAAGKPTV